MQKKVVFHIHGKTAERTAYIMAKVLKRHKYINVAVEDGECVLTTSHVDGSFNSWLIEYLTESKRFLGRFHRDHPLYNNEKIEASIERHEGVACRFGWWESGDMPEEKSMFDYHRQRVAFSLSGFPKYLCVLRAMKVTGYNAEPHDDNKGWQRKNYIYDLVKNYGFDEAEATKRVDKYFAHYNIEPAPKKPISREEKKRNARKTQERCEKMIGVLRMYSSPKQRAEYINRSGNIVDWLYLRFLLQKYGREWFVENVGEITGLT